MRNTVLSLLLASLLCAAHASLQVKNTSSYIGNNQWKWTIFVDGPAEELAKVKCVTYHLHETFPNPIQTVCDTAGNFGFTAHGRNIVELEKATVLTKATSDFLINVTDNVACYILHVYHHEHPQRNVPRIEYKDNEEFNAYFDELYEKVRFSEYQYLPSEVLFGVDPTAYRTEVENFKQRQG